MCDSVCTCVCMCVCTWCVCVCSHLFVFVFLPYVCVRVPCTLHAPPPPRPPQELESAHLGASEELEKLYEKRLELESEKMRQMAADRNDLQFRLEEQMKRIKNSHGEELSVGG